MQIDESFRAYFYAKKRELLCAVSHETLVAGWVFVNFVLFQIYISVSINWCLSLFGLIGDVHKFFRVTGLRDNAQ